MNVESTRTVNQDDESVPFLDLRAQHAPLKPELMQVFSRALETGGFVGGPELESFECEFAEFCGTDFAVGVSSGTDALRLALLAMGVGSGDAVVTVPNTFIATTEAISQTGAAIEFVDVDRETCLMDPERLKHHFENRKSEHRLAAVIPVHLYGQCVDMDAICALSEKYGAKTIEDAAQAHGAEYAERRAGGLGDAGCFSFYPSKNLGACGEAGAVTTNDIDVAERVRMLRDHGQTEKYVHGAEGYNSRLDAIQAGVLRVKLRHVLDWNRKRREVARRYDDGFAALDAIQPVRTSQNNISSRHLYVVHVPDRDDFRAALDENGVATGVHYPISLHLIEPYSHLGHAIGDFPNAEWSAAHLVSLPIYPEMTDAQVDKVIAVVTAWATK